MAVQKYIFSNGGITEDFHELFIKIINQLPFAQFVPVQHVVYYLFKINYSHYANAVNSN